MDDDYGADDELLAAMAAAGVRAPAAAALAKVATSVTLSTCMRKVRYRSEEDALSPHAPSCSRSSATSWNRARPIG